jgi:hypothetical protein
MTDLDLAGMWRTMRVHPADVPRVGAHLETAGPGITISVAHECLTALPSRRNGVTVRLPGPRRWRGGRLCRWGAQRYPGLLANCVRPMGMVAMADPCCWHSEPPIH